MPKLLNISNQKTSNEVALICLLYGLARKELKMPHKTYTPESALKKLLRVGEVKEETPYSFIVKMGTVGNGTLGAIDYLNKHTNYTVTIVGETKFDKSKAKLIRRAA